MYHMTYPVEEQVKNKYTNFSSLNLTLDKAQNLVNIGH